MRKKLVAALGLLAIIGAILYGYGAKIGPFQQEAPTLAEIVDSRRQPEVESILDGLTLEQKVGQMFMGCFYDGTPSGETVEKYHLGGVLLFGASFQDTNSAQFTAKLEAMDQACAIVPITAVDEEGGSVVRVSADPAFRSSPFASPRALYAEGGLEEIVVDAHEKNKLLSGIGIDMNLAPVCDISQDPKDFMYSRSLGQDADTTAAYIKEVVTACVEDGIACSLKHFPGYGNSADTHKGMAVDKRSLDQLRQNDLIPFKAGIDAGAHAVLVSHNIVSAIDDDLPASLSPAVNRFLRQKMAFDGVVITDDLSMRAIAQFLPDVDSAVTAVMAGNDMLCTGDYAHQYKAVLEAVKTGLISEDRIDASVRRILKLKLELGIMETPEEGQDDAKKTEAETADS